MGAVTQNSMAEEGKVPENVTQKKITGDRLKVSIVSPIQNGVYATLSSAGGKITGSRVLPASPYVSAPTYGMTLYFNE